MILINTFYIFNKSLVNFLDVREQSENCSGSDTALRDNLKIASMALINGLLSCGEGEVCFLF